MAITLTVNGQSRTIDVDPDTPLLWVVRDTLGLTGTHWGCDTSNCGGRLAAEAGGIHEPKQRGQSGQPRPAPEARTSPPTRIRK